jgi:hypothetical protein
MKHLSSCLTMLVLGAVPLTAAALDYGPNHPLLAAENGAPQLPSAQTHAESMGTLPKPVVAEVDGGGSAEAATVVPRVAPVASPGVTRPAPEASASNKARSRIAKPATAPTPASWQSLLPGSIQ